MYMIEQLVSVKDVLILPPVEYQEKNAASLKMVQDIICHRKIFQKERVIYMALD
jgi:hypothetical protein